MHTLPQSSTPACSPNHSKVGSKALLLALLGCLCLFACICSISLGPVQIGLRRLWLILIGSENSGALAQIVWQVRLPRTVAALLSGMALATSGALLQAVMQNPMAAPSLIGVNSGAGLAAMLVFALWPAQIGVLVPATFGGALAALGIIFIIASRAGNSRTTLILSGLAVSGLLGAGIDTVRLLRPDAMLGAAGFMIGGFSGTGWKNLSFAIPYLIAGLLLALLTGPMLNIITLGDEVALSLGVRVRRARLLLLALAALLAAASVCLAGLVGFVGLIIPHAARLMLGYDQRWLLPGTMLLGGSFVLGCDILARIIFAPYELPVGILLSFLGGPFFIYLLYQNKRTMDEAR